MDMRSYDFFYKNGVPKWRGTGYYYSRFRPGLGVGGCQPELMVEVNSTFDRLC